MAQQQQADVGGAPPFQQGPLQADEDAHSEDPLDQILENYNFICHPELRLKFKQELKTCSLGIALAKPWHHRPRLRLVVKPALGERFSRTLQKLLVVPTHGLLCVYSTKIPLKFLRLQFMASFNWITRQPTLDYRITTKWSDGARVKHKETYNLGKHALLRAKWNMDLHLPDLEGHLGGSDSMQMEALDVDYGSMDFEISQVDLLIHSPWDYVPPDVEAASSRAAQAAGPSARRAEEQQLQQVEAGSAAVVAEGRLGKGEDKAGRRRSGRAGRRGSHADAEGQQQLVPQQQQQQEPAVVAATQAAPARAAAPYPAPSYAERQAGGAPPDWLISFLSKLSVQPYQKPGSPTSSHGGGSSSSSSSR